ncbi:MAG: hypothetical protein KF773_24560 [Deltaproteobacteria bacterium]|nr:hypothetical protein [Deltaproteobacteria bacterium]MCW5808828.1 hypothetical protein [Deltaproteobacteria bacterium]
MITIAIVAILAALAIPSFLGTSRRSKVRTEVTAYFNDLRMRIEQFAEEHGSFPPTLGESMGWPAAASMSKQPIFPLPAAWEAIRMMPTGPTEVYCSYTWATGAGGDATNVGPQAAAFFAFTAPDQDWYYLLAHCDLDGDPLVDSFYFSSSANPILQIRDEGR